MEQQIRYAQTADGVAIAYAVVGHGPPLLVVRSFLNPDVASELGEEPEWRAPWLELAATRTLVFWDHRGMGLSGAADTHTLDSGVLDMEAVVDATGAKHFDMLAMLTPVHFAIAYGVRHPERIRRMALLNPSHPGGSPRAASPDLPDIATTHFRAYADLFALQRHGWDRPVAARRQADFMAERYTGESWAQLNESIEALDATPLAHSLTVPALIVVGDSATATRVLTQRVQFQRLLAATIPHARLSIVKNTDPHAYVPLIDAFLGVDAAAPPADNAAPSGTAIILFADIFDSTVLTERLGDAAFRKRARELDTSMRSIIGEAGGTTIDAKTLGDGILATFPAASQAIEAALAFERAADAAQLQLHIGIHAGDVIREDGNVFGGAVIIASRICALSAPGEVLVSRTVADLARTSAGVVFDDRGEHTLKGVAEPQRLYAARGK